MQDLGRKLSRPSSGVLVLLAVVVVLALILAAAYHGSDAQTASACGPARGLLRRATADATAARAALASTGSVPPTTVSALQRDDNDVNNVINGEQRSDPGFDGKVLPVADNLGRVVTDLSAHPGAGAVQDLTALETALDAAAAYCR